MNEKALRAMLGEVIRETSRELAAPAAVCERAFEERLPAMLVARDPAAEVELTEGATEAMVALLLQASEERRSAVTPPRIAWLPPERLNGKPKPRASHSRKRWGVALGAVAATLLMVALLVSRPWQERDDLVKTGPPPSPRSPLSPPPSPEELIPDRPPPHREQGSVKSQRRSPSIAVQRVAVATFGQIVGEPLVYGREGGSPFAATTGARVVLGARVETGDMDRAEIRLDDGSVIILGFNTILSIPSQAQEPGTKRITVRDFELKKGTIVAKVVATLDKQTFTVKTPVATAEVLGTEFRLGLETVPSNRSKGLPERKLQAVLQVKAGRVAFFNDFGRVEAASMMESSAQAGSAPTEPKRLYTLRVFGFEGTDQRMERRAFLLDEEGAADHYVFPRGSAGFMAGTVPNGELRIVTMTENASARASGLKVKDAILALDGQRQTMDGLRREIYQRGGQTVRLTIRRKGAEMEFLVPVIIDDPVAPTLPRRVADALFEATRPALSGDIDTSLRRLTALADMMPHPAVYNNLGVVYERLDRMGPAIRSYQRAVSLDGRTGLYRRNLARALQNIGNFDRAIELLEEAVSLEPKSMHAIFRLVEVYELVDRADDALALLDATSHRLPNSVSVWNAKSQALAHAGRMDDAIQAAKQATVADPDCAAAYFRLGLALTFKGRFSESEQAFAKAIDLDPCLATYYNSRAINLNAMGKTKEAEAEYRKAITLDPEFVPSLTGLGMILYFTGRDEEAEAVLRKAIRLDPDHSKALGFLGLVLERTNRLEEAAKAYRKAADLDHQFFEWHPDLVHILGKLGRFQEVVPVLEEAVRISPETEWLQALLGWSLIENHRWEQAAFAYRACLKVAPTGPNALNATNNLAYALTHTGNLEEAGRLLDRALAIKPDDAETAANKAYLLAVQGVRLDEALEWAKKGVSVQDPHAQHFLALGLVHFKRGEYDLAIPHLNKAVVGFGKVFLAADALVTLGQVHEAKKDVPAAIDAYRRALAIEPGNKPAAEALKRLGGQP